MKIKLPKITLDDILSVIFIIALIANLIGLVWLLIAFILFTYSVHTALGLFLGGLFTMVACLVISYIAEYFSN